MADRGSRHEVNGRWRKPGRDTIHRIFYTVNCYVRPSNRARSLLPWHARIKCRVRSVRSTVFASITFTQRRPILILLFLPHFLRNPNYGGHASLAILSSNAKDKGMLYQLYLFESWLTSGELKLFTDLQRTVWFSSGCDPFELDLSFRRSWEHWFGAATHKRTWCTQDLRNEFETLEGCRTREKE